jgi:RNA-directed DNA polymerase
MHSYNGLFKNMISDSSLTIAFMDASKGKRNRNDVQRVLNDFENEKQKLREILDTETFQLVKHPSCIINEANCHKEREIVKPYFKYEQVVHHLVVGQLKPIVMKGFYEYSCGSIPNRGCHYGKKYIEKWVRNYPKDQTIYVLKMDIRHFFENVDHDILKNKLSKVIRDKKFLRLVFKIIDNHEVGLPLGYYTSQWFANFYLKDYDHYVKEVLGAEHYMRYMDDMIILSTDKAKLHTMKKEIEKYLSEKLHVELKPNWQIFPLAEDREDHRARPLDFMGFKFYRNYTSLRKSILYRARQKANRIRTKRHKHRPITWKDATSMISYMGWINHTSTYHYYLKYIKSKVIIRVLKYKVSKHQRKENRNDRLDYCKGVAS